MKKVLLYVTNTKEILGIFRSYQDANDFHDGWCDKWEKNHSALVEVPDCTFAPMPITVSLENGVYYAYCHHRNRELAFGKGETELDAVLSLSFVLYQKLCSISDLI